MRKQIYTVITACLLTILLTGCSGAKEQTSNDTETITLSLMLPQTHYKTFFQNALQRFETEYPSYKIEVQLIPDNQWIDLVKMKTAVQETPDIIRIDKGLILEAGVEHFVEFDETAPWYNRVIPEQRDNKLVNGRLYGLPVNSSSGIGIVYNKEIFAQHEIEIPDSWEAFISVCRQLKDAGVVPLYASDKDSWTVQIAFSAAAPQAVDSETWKLISSNDLKWADIPEFTEVLDEVAGLRSEGLTNADYSEATYASAVTEMADQNVAMYITGEFFMYDALEKNPDAPLSMMPLPYEKDLYTVIDGPGQLSVFKNSENIEAAEFFLDWFSQPDNMDEFTSGWGCMTVYKDQKQQMTEWQKKLNDEYISKGRTVPEVAELIVGIDYNDFWDYQQEMFNGYLSARQVLEKWDQSFAQQMREHGETGWQEP